MSNTHSTTTATQQRSQRKDGDATRAHILEVAGQLFAERGLADTTSKMICQQAQTNMAAVNYHFGSLGGLYLAVLQEVQLRLLNLDYLTELANSPLSARDKLSSFIDGLVTDLIGNDSWHTRLWARELVSPSPYAAEIIESAASPKFGLISGILSELTGLPVKSPELLRCLYTFMSPCVMLLVVSRELDTPMKPLFRQPPEAVAAHIKAFVFAGLDAVASLYSISTPTSAVEE